MDDKSLEILEIVKAQSVQFIDLQFTDIFGVTKSVTITPSDLDEALDRGLWFDGSSIQGFARIQESDMFLQPDPVTFRILPWTVDDPLGSRARIICDVYNPDGTPFEGDPRYALKRAVAHAAEMGYIFNTGPELEFFLFRANGTQAVPHDVGGYFDFSPNDEAQRVRSDITQALQALKDSRRDGTPRSRRGAARDRFSLRKCPAHRRQCDHLQIYGQGYCGQARFDGDFHAQACVWHQR